MEIKTAYATVYIYLRNNELIFFVENINKIIVFTLPLPLRSLRKEKTTVVSAGTVIQSGYRGYLRSQDSCNLPTLPGCLPVIKYRESPSQKDRRNSRLNRAQIVKCKERKSEKRLDSKIEHLTFQRLPVRHTLAILNLTGYQ